MSSGSTHPLWHNRAMMKDVQPLPRDHNPPLVSVVMGTFNGERYLPAAIDSILSQTFGDFELIVIDDCSTDHTPNILRQIEDARMRVVRNERNLGISETLNKGINLAVGRYVAFQDHDDLSLSNRIEKQSDFLARHPDVAMVGSGCRIVDASGALVKDVIAKCDDAELRWGLLWYNPFFQTTLMVRRDVLLQISGYSSDPMYRLSEDYEMMSRVAMEHPVANLPQPLGCWRMHPHSTSASATQGERLLESRANISVRNVREVWRRSGKQVPSDKAEQVYKAMWSFQFAHAGEQPRASADQARCAMGELKWLECAFSVSAPGLKQTGGTRTARYYKWARDAVAMALREDCGLKARAALLFDALQYVSFGTRLLPTKRRPSGPGARVVIG